MWMFNFGTKLKAVVHLTSSDLLLVWHALTLEIEILKGLKLIEILKGICICVCAWVCVLVTEAKEATLYRRMQSIHRHQQ